MRFEGIGDAIIPPASAGTTETGICRGRDPGEHGDLAGKRGIIQRPSPRGVACVLQARRPGRAGLTLRRGPPEGTRNPCTYRLTSDAEFVPVCAAASLPPRTSSPGCY